MKYRVVEYPFSKLNGDTVIQYEVQRRVWLLWWSYEERFDLKSQAITYRNAMNCRKVVE